MNVSKGFGIARCAALVVAAAASMHAQGNTELKEQVRQAEIAFAKTMADRSHSAFASFLAEDAVFINGDRVMRGSKQIADGWKRFYDAPAAPFSWEPTVVEVLESGTLALSSGPVRDPSGKRVGTFNSVWRREAGGKWKVVFDRGCPPCECTPAQ